MTDRRRYDQVAKLHIAVLNQSFMATLGTRFLSLMYQAIDECETSSLIVEERAGEVVGFVSGTGSMGPIYRQMLRHWIRLAYALAPTLIRPRKLRRIFEILRYTSGKSLDADLPPHELLSLAVAHHARRQGVAERLYRCLIDHFIADRATAFRIIVGEKLGPAHHFYRRQGAEERGKVALHGDIHSTIYVHDLGAPANAALQKEGRHSVGVAPQYASSLGKTASLLSR